MAEKLFAREGQVFQGRCATLVPGAAVEVDIRCTHLSSRSERVKGVYGLLHRRRLVSHQTPLARSAIQIGLGCQSEYEALADLIPTYRGNWLGASYAMIVDHPPLSSSSRRVLSD